MKDRCQYVVRWVSGIFMMLVLVWLTVSTPFVSAFQAQMAEREMAGAQTGGHSADEEMADANPFANTTEEKTESGSITFSEEYLHVPHEIIHTQADLLKHDNCGHTALYIALHGELLSPPPEV